METIKRRWPWAVVACVLSATSSALENGPSGLPFRLCQEYLIVARGSMGASERLEFLIDTGTTQTLVDLNIAKRLRLGITEGIELEGFTNGQARKMMVPELRFGPVVVRSARMLVADLSFFSSYGTRIDAIIGLDVLRLSSFRIDYASRRIAFGPVADSASTVAFQAVAPLLLVDLKIGTQIARLMVDTGAPRLTLFPNRMQSRLPGFLLKGARTVQSPGGMSQVRDVELAAIRLGPREWLHVLALLADVPASSFQDFDGMLAPSSLAVKSIDFDFQRNRLSWEK